MIFDNENSLALELERQFSDNRCHACGRLPHCLLLRLGRAHQQYAGSLRQHPVRKNSGNTHARRVSNALRDHAASERWREEFAPEGDNGLPSSLPVADKVFPGLGQTPQQCGKRTNGTTRRRGRL